MNFQSIREKYDTIDFPTLNRIRMVAILACTLVFGVLLYHTMPGGAPPQENGRPMLASVYEVPSPRNEYAQASQEGDSSPIPEAPSPVSPAKEDPSDSATPAASEQLPKTISAKSVIIADASSAKILYEKNADAKLPEASLTKLMTAVVVREHSKADEEIEITKRAVDTEGVSGFLRVGERFTASDLLKIMLIVSSNDAAAAFEDYFAARGLDLAALMNEKAKALGMQDTYFMNVSGLDEEGHYASARDLLKLVSFSLSDALLWDMLSLRSAIVWSVNKKIKHALTSTNELLARGVPGVLGGKTGYTKNALGCMITLVERKGGKAVIIILGSEDRFADTKALVQFTQS